MSTVKFDELNISPALKRAVEDMGFEEMTPIQAKAIPYILEGKDIIGHAQTGTGKTAAYAIPVLEMIDTNDKSLQSLIICPTRELAIQVSEEIRRLAKYMNGVRSIPIYGGQPIDRQIRSLKQGVQIIVGTPGRIMDHMRRRTIKLGNLKNIILDEADEMLNMGFRDDIEVILQDTPQDRQVTLFSATMPRAILEIAKTYQKNHEIVKVVHKKLTVPSIDQFYYEVSQRNKFEVLTRLIDIYDPKLTLVFCNTKRKVDEVMGSLQGRGYFAEGLHGDMQQPQRDRVMNAFRNGTIDILVATDVAARGIDVDDVEIVFNYDLPQDEEYYVHRIGRTGRAGRSGKAITFISGREIYKMKDIERYTQTKITRQQAPSISDVEEAKVGTVIGQIKENIKNENLTKQVHVIEKLLGDDNTSVDIAAALLKMVTNEHKKENQNSHDDILSQGREPERVRERPSAKAGMARLFLNAGRNHKISPKDIMSSIASERTLSSKSIGKIDIYDKYSFIEVPKKDANEVIKVMKRNGIKGKSINVEPVRKRSRER